MNLRIRLLLLTTIAFVGGCNLVPAAGASDCTAIRFVDTGGAAVIDATVRVYYGDDLIAGPFVSDECGKVAIPILVPHDLSLTLVCSAPGRELIVENLDDVIGTTATMHECEGTRVRAIDVATGQPIAGAEWVLSALPGVANVTDSAGRCVLAGMQGEPASVVAAVWHATHAAKLQDARRVSSGAASEWVVPMELAPRRRVEIRFPQGVRDDDATVRVAGLQKTVEVESDDGRFFAELPPATLRATSEWHVDGCWPLVVAPEDDLETLLFERARTHIGKVVAAKGPVQGACVWVRDDDHSDVTFTNDRGWFVVRVSSTTQPAAVAAPGLVVADVELEVSASEEPQLVELEPAGGLRIVLREDPSRSPGGVCVYQRVDAKWPWRKVLDRGARNAQTICVDGLAPGNYLVTWGSGDGIEREVRITRPAEVVEVRFP